MEIGKPIVRRPPAATLVKAPLILLFLASPLVMGIVQMIRAQNGLLQADGGLFWFGLGLVAALAAGAILFLYIALRMLSAWFLFTAGIYVAGETIKFNIPRRKAWWHPILSVDARQMPVAEVRSTRFTEGARGGLVVVGAEGTEIEIPSGTFAVGPYQIDQKLRAVPGVTMGPRAPRREWVASWKARLGMVVVGILCVALTIGIFVAAGDKVGDLPKIVVLPMILAIGLFLLSVIHRGRLVLNELGCFFDRNGVTSFYGWESLPTCKVGLRTDALLITSLTIEGKGGKFALTNILGLGFPLKEVVELLNAGPKGATSPKGLGVR